MTIKDFDFRIWDDTEGKIFYIDKSLSPYPLLGSKMYGEDKDKLIVDLYIGLDDSFGKKIYANDIVAFYKGDKPKNLYDFILFVEFDYMRGVAFIPNTYKIDVTLFEILIAIKSDPSYKLEVVGNKHETEAFLPPLDEED